MQPCKALLAGAAVTGCLAAGAAWSQDKGPYIGGSLGRSDMKDACEGVSISCDKTDKAWKIFGGYQFNRNLAVELGYHNLGEVKATAGTLTETIKTNAWELVGVGLWPVANQFGVYGKLGGYRAEAKDSLDGKDTNTGVTLGAGLQWDPMAPLGVRLEWQRYNKVGGNNTGGKDNIDVLSLGAVWRFR